MAFADSIYWQILTAMQTGMRDDLTFEVHSADTASEIDNDAIIIRKLNRPDRGSRDYDAGDSGEKKPGIIIVPGTVAGPPEQGTNERDDYEYKVMVQIIDKDYDELTNLRTYLRWQEQVAHYFHNKSVIVDDTKGKTYLTNSIRRDVLDDREWVQHDEMVAAVEVRHMSRENRGVT